MPSNHIILQYGTKTIKIGRAGDHEYIDTYCFKNGFVGDEDFLYRLLYRWFHDKLMTSPQHTKLIILENIMLSLGHKKLLCKVGLQRLGVASMSFIPDILMSCVAAGVRSGIVIDIGAEHTVIAPVVELRIIDSHIGITNRGAGYLHKKLEESPAVVSPDSTSLASPSEADQELILNIVESQLMGSFFSGDYDMDEMPICPLLYRLTSKFPVVLKQALNSRIILTGSICEYQYLKNYLAQFLSTEFQVLDTLGPWAGGSLFEVHRQKLKSADPMEITQEMMAENCPIPDWHLKRFYI
ncbi:LAFE_0H09714g1_1 [Lachancea fermentati]|uniref:LAFE_0H09714g1_1 n=1 Tax=Lachancea fermentati TaxID=4955 RepID=A0A1G4MKC1_LACFM|nr:LAFE_0H09714g1_1 [Lachancea fermentati]